MIIVWMIFDCKREFNRYRAETSAFGLNSIKLVCRNRLIVWFASDLWWKNGYSGQVVKEAGFLKKQNFDKILWVLLVKKEIIIVSFI